jgi:hypothetical protein
LGLKILKFFDSDPDPGSGIFLTLDPGSGIRDGKIQYLGSATLAMPVLLKYESGPAHEIQ